ncbi:MAG: hypothetical protein GXP35_00405, partial [Actinobacteria bacterium]|nr:hypothetical protein [Actinomycetota bacterium]
DDDPTAPPVASNPTSSILTTTTAARSGPTTTVPPGIAEEFATNLAARSEAAAQRLVQLTATASLARGYIEHQIAALSVLPEQPLGRVDNSASNEVVVCDPTPTGGNCRTFGNFAVGADGLLTDFEIDGQSLEGRLLVGGRSGIDQSVTVTVVSAYLTIPADELVIVIDVTNQADDVALINGFAAVHRSSVGAEFEVTSVFGADEVAPGATSRAILVFAGGTIGGVLTVPASSSDFTTTFEIAIELLEP